MRAETVQRIAAAREQFRNRGAVLRSYIDRVDAGATPDPDILRRLTDPVEAAARELHQASRLAREGA